MVTGEPRWSRNNSSGAAAANGTVSAAAPPPATTPTAETAAAAAAKPSPAPSGGKHRKDQLTERLSRSRRSRFFAAAIESGGGSDVPTAAVASGTQGKTEPPPSATPPSPAVLAPSPTERDRKRIALAKAHRKKGNGPSMPSPTNQTTAKEGEEKRSLVAMNAAPLKGNSKKTKATAPTLCLNGPTTVEEKGGANGKAVANGKATLGKKGAVATNAKANIAKSSAATTTTSTKAQVDPVAKQPPLARAVPTTTKKTATPTMTTTPTSDGGGVDALLPQAPSPVEKRHRALALSRAKRAASLKSRTAASEDEEWEDVGEQEPLKEERRASTIAACPSLVPASVPEEKSSASSLPAVPSTPGATRRPRLRLGASPGSAHRANKISATGAPLSLTSPAPPPALSHSLSTASSTSAASASTGETTLVLLAPTQSGDSGTTGSRSNKGGTKSRPAYSSNQTPPANSPPWVVRSVAGVKASESATAAPATADAKPAHRPPEAKPTAAKWNVGPASAVLRPDASVTPQPPVAPRAWNSQKSHTATMPVGSPAPTTGVYPAPTATDASVLPAAPLEPDQPPPSPTRANPWKQMAQVKPARNGGGGRTPASSTKAESKPTTPATRRWERPSLPTPVSLAPNHAAAAVAAEEIQVEEAVPESSRTKPLPRSTNKYLEMYRSRAGEGDDERDEHRHSGDGPVHLEEKKDDDDHNGYRVTPVSLATRKARYGSAAGHAAVGPSSSPTPSRPGTLSPCPLPSSTINTAHRATSPAPIYPRWGRHSPAAPSPVTSEPPAVPEDATLAQSAQAERNEAPEDSPPPAVETPERVSVSSMKARFGSSAKTTPARATTPKNSKRLVRLTVSNDASPVGRTMDKNRSLNGPSPPSGCSVVRLRAASPGLTQALSPHRPQTASKLQQTLVLESAEPKVEPTPSEPSVGIETPAKITVSSMKAKFLPPPPVAKAGFSQPTVSSAAKRSPRRRGGAPSDLPGPKTASGVGTTDGRGGEAVPPFDLRDAPRSVIETPDPVNVQSMKGIFGGRLERPVSAPRTKAVTTKTPFNTPASPPTHLRPTARTDVSTPVAPPVPCRSTFIGRPVEASPSSWLKKPGSDESEKIPTEEGQADVTAMEALAFPVLDMKVETADCPTRHAADSASTAREFEPTMRPKSPRERPTNIPKWKQTSTIDADPTTRMFEVPSIKKAKSADAGNRSFSEEPAVQERERLASDESVKLENCPPVSPRSPRDRPWTKDLESPKGWRQRFQSSLDGKLAAELMPNPSASRIALLNTALARQGVSSDAIESTTEAEESGTQMVYSLKQMAADSVHAVDFERSISVTELKKSSGSNEDDESQGSVGESAFPQNLPLEFAKSLERQSDKSKSPTRGPVALRVVDNPSVDEQALSGIVFGDPSTYGAAGGGVGVEKTPPKVKDRARAIAQWKGGQGIRPNKSTGSSSDTEGESQRGMERLDSATSSDRASDGNAIVGKVAFSAKSGEDNEAMIVEPTASGPSVSSSSPPQERRRGASSVLRFWSGTPEEDFEGACTFMNSDPGLEAPPAACDDTNPSEDRMASFRKPRVEDINIGSVSEWRRIDSPSAASSKSPRKASFPDDPFPIDTLAGLYEEPVKKDRKDAAFDPFFDVEDDVGAFDTNVLDFFNASIRVAKPGVTPSSPAPTTFSVPNFEPKAYEDPAEDLGFDKLLPGKPREGRLSWGNRKGRRSSRAKV